MRALFLALGCALALMSSPVPAQDKPDAERTSAEWLALIQADKKAIVGRSMEPTALLVETIPKVTMAIAPSSAIPTRSITKPGTRPRAIPR